MQSCAADWRIGEKELHTHMIYFTFQLKIINSGSHYKHYHIFNPENKSEYYW